MCFSNNIVQVAGKSLATADTLSRVPVSVPDEQDHFMEFETQLCVKAVIEGFSASD